MQTRTIAFLFLALLCGSAVADHHRRWKPRPHRALGEKAFKHNNKFYRTKDRTKEAALAFRNAFDALEERPEIGAKGDFVAFLKGFAHGMEVVLGDPEACAQDYANTLAFFSQAYTNLRDGFKKLKISLIAKGLVAFADGVEAVAAGLRDCGLEELAGDITKVVIMIRTGQLREFIEHELIHIIGHGREFYHLFKGIVVSWQAKNFYDVGDNVGEIVALLLEGVKQKPVDITPKDVGEFVRGLAEGLGTAMDDPTACARNLENMIADFEAAWSDIRDGVRKVSVKIIRRALEEFADGIKHVADAFSSCGLQALEEKIRRVVDLIRDGKAIDVVAKSIIHILIHGIELINDFKAAADNWKKGNYRGSGIEAGKIIGIIASIPVV